MMDSATYFVAKHFKISIPEVLSMTPEEFEQSFVWASAQSQIESEEMQKATGEMKGGTRIGSTDAGQPFPFE